MVQFIIKYHERDICKRHNVILKMIVMKICFSFSGVTKVNLRRWKGSPKQEIA